MVDQNDFRGEFRSDQSLFAGNAFHGDVHFHNDRQSDAERTDTTLDRATPLSSEPRYGDIYISDQAKVHLGNMYAFNKDLFESGSADEKRAALLNLLHYEGLDLKREQLALADISPDSFSWTEKTTFPTWLRSGSTPFWIKGKPGSGKSTLMKYLADSKSTLTELQTDGRPWIVVHFFFDYRAGKTMANQILGMLKGFLRQLSSRVAHIAEKLDEAGSRQELAFNNVETYISILSDVLRSYGNPICAFIDGLDEYDDDLWGLCSGLEMMRKRTGLKLCVASRLEAAFETSFASYPTITMQDHNRSSIKTFTQRSIARYITENPLRHNPFTAEVEDSVVDKAQGVILWVRLVMNEMFNSCDRNTTPSQLLGLLELLPAEIEELYARILNKIKYEYQQEAALVLHMIIEGEDLQFLVSAVLFEAWDFLESTMVCDTSMTADVNLSACEARAKALLGNMIEFVSPDHKSFRGSEWPSVRLVHRSLSTYLSRSKWIDSRLPESLAAKYPDCLWARLALDVIVQATNDSAIKLDKPATELTNPDDIFETLGLKFAAFERQKFKLISPGFWSTRKRLLYFCTEQFPFINDRIRKSETKVDLSFTWPEAGSKLAVLHFHGCYLCHGWGIDRWERVRMLRLHHSSTLYLAVHISHGWDIRRISASDISQLSTTILDDLFVLSLTFLARDKQLYERERYNYGFQVLERFATIGICVESRHLCSLPDGVTEARMSLLKGIADATRLRPPSAVWSGNHDKDCPYAGEQISVLRHWLVMTQHGDWLKHLDIFLACQSNIDDPVDAEGAGLLQAILDLARRDSSDDMRGYRGMFVAATQRNARPTSTNSGSLLSRERALLRKRKLHEKLTLRKYRGFAKSDELNRFSEEVVKALKYYEDNNHCWPDLESMLPNKRKS